MPRWSICLVACCAVASPAHANQPPPRPLSAAWDAATRAAYQDLEACKRLGGATYGDVDVRYDVHTKRWSSSSSKSLGKLGPQIAKCMRDAITRRFPLHYDYDDSAFRRGLTSAVTTGVRVPVLPPAATLLPVWRRAIGTGKDAAAARSSLAKRLPPDYTLTKDVCLATDRHAIENGQYLWLPTTGAWVPRIWHAALKTLLGTDAHAVMWSAPGEMVVKRGPALCLVPFDAAKQAQLRASMDAVGSCWAGRFEDILLRPRVAFPTSERYTSVSTFAGRTCASTTTGKVTCCGANEPPLPVAPKPVTSITLGHGFACGLDAAGAAVCWGAVPSPPTGTFTKLSASHEQVCGVTKSGALACWGRPGLTPPPTGDFTDIAVAQGRACALRVAPALRTDGTLACWGEHQTGFPPGAFSSVSASWTRACGVRHDGLAACWNDNRSPADIALPDAFAEVAVSDGYQLCGRHRDGTVRCTDESPDRGLSPVPASKMLALTGHQSQTCGLRDDRSIECWGEPWPGKWGGDNTWPYGPSLFSAPSPPPTTTLRGRVVDEANRPIAGAEVVVCNEHGPCSSIVHLAKTSGDPLGVLANRVANVKPDSFVRATTDRDGRWTAQLAIRPVYAADKVIALITAPGRELVERSVAYLTPDKLGKLVTLRPAIDLEVAAACDGKPCSGKLSIAVAQYRRYDGTTLAHLTPGMYIVQVWSDRGQPTERRGRLVLDVTFATQSQRPTLALQPIGTGKAIRGIASLSGKRDGVGVYALCGGDGDDAVLRSATTDARGNFVLENVGPPPCTVRLSSAADGAVTVDQLPAAGLVLTGTAIAPPPD